MAEKVILLDNIRSLHNVGAIFRTADGAGWNKIYLCGYTGCPPDRRIEKVSLGAENFIAWEGGKEILELIRDLKSQGFFIFALEQTSSAKNLLEFKHNHPKIALIVGNEVEGVVSEALKEADESLQIPMRGQKGSLNVSIATGIALYQL